MDVRRIVTARFGAYAAAIALLTGLGLFFLAGVRIAESWGWFALASFGAIVAAAWSIRSALGPGAEGVRPAREDPEAAEPEPSVGLAPGQVTPSTQLQPEPDEVDYLMALRHEFRTPLNAVLGFSDVLLSGIDGEVNDSQREDLEIIRASGIRLRILLDSAFDL